MEKEFALSVVSDDAQVTTRGNTVSITMWVDKKQIHSIVDCSLMAIVEYLQERGFTVEMTKKGQADNDCPA